MRGADMRIFDLSKSSRAPRIRIINLVDILFILLIFFIATTTFRVESPATVRVTLPQARTAEEIGRRVVERVLITIGADETLYYNETPIPLRALEIRLREARNQHPDLEVEFSADRSVSYGMVVAVVDAARAAGIVHLTAFTRKSLLPTP